MILKRAHNHYITRFRRKIVEIFLSMSLMAPFAQRTINIVCPQIVAKGLLIINDTNIFSPQNTRATNQDHYEKYQTFQLWLIDRRYLFIDELRTIFLHLNSEEE